MLYSDNSIPICQKCHHKRQPKLYFTNTPSGMENYYYQFYFRIKIECSIGILNTEKLFTCQLYKCVLDVKNILANWNCNFITLPPFRYEPYPSTNTFCNQLSFEVRTYHRCISFRAYYSAKDVVSFLLGNQCHNFLLFCELLLFVLLFGFSNFSLQNSNTLPWSALIYSSPGLNSAY